MTRKARAPPSFLPPDIEQQRKQRVHQTFAIEIMKRIMIGAFLGDGDGKLRDAPIEEAEARLGEAAAVETASETLQQARLGEMEIEMLHALQAFRLAADEYSGRHEAHGQRRIMSLRRPRIVLVEDEGPRIVEFERDEKAGIWRYIVASCVQRAGDFPDVRHDAFPDARLQSADDGETVRHAVHSRAEVHSHAGRVRLAVALEGRIKR
ncbi:MAG: hypothetical protein R3E51_09950 [Rhizobiaceae bacterium]